MPLHSRHGKESSRGDCIFIWTDDRFEGLDEAYEVAAE